MPKKELLLRMFHEAVKEGAQKKRKFVLDHHEGLLALGLLMNNKNRTPEASWILLLIAAVAGETHEIFQKGYTPPKEEEVLMPLHQQALVWNGDGLYDNAVPVSCYSVQFSIKFPCWSNFLVKNAPARQMLKF